MPSINRKAWFTPCVRIVNEQPSNLKTMGHTVRWNRIFAVLISVRQDICKPKGYLLGAFFAVPVISQSYLLWVCNTEKCFLPRLRNNFLLFPPIFLFLFFHTPSLFYIFQRAKWFLITGFMCAYFLTVYNENFRKSQVFQMSNSTLYKT